MGGQRRLFKTICTTIGAPMQELFTANSILKNNWPERIRWPRLQLLSPGRLPMLHRQVTDGLLPPSFTDRRQEFR